MLRQMNPSAAKLAPSSTFRPGSGLREFPPVTRSDLVRFVLVSLPKDCTFRRGDDLSLPAR